MQLPGEQGQHNADPQLLCAGNAIVDVYAEVPPEFCEQFFLSAGIQHVSAETTAAILAALTQECSAAFYPEKSAGIVMVSGGNAANTAKVASRLGVRCAFAGAAGNDAVGGFFAEELQREEISLYLSRKKSPTGLFISLISKKIVSDIPAFTTYIAASPSAAEEFDDQDLDEAMFKTSGKILQVFLIDGFFLEKERLLNRILALADKYNLTLALDMGTEHIAERQAHLIKEKKSFFWDRTSRSRPMILFLNEKEAQVFAKTLVSDWHDIFIAASKDQNILAAVKLAEHGAAVFSGGNVFRAETEPVTAAENTAAGDAFAAGFLAAWLQGKNPEQCGQAGNSAAALVLQNPGTSQINIPAAAHETDPVP